VPSNPQDTVIIVSERSIYSGALVGGPTGLTGATGATGPQGTAGTTGAAGAVGATGPQGTAGTAGAAGATGATGPQGTAGTAGANGATGAAANTWYGDSGNPSNSLGVDGDFYLDQSSGIAYKKGTATPGQWALYTSLKGSNGANGAIGATGATGPGLPTGGTANQVLTKINSTDYNTQWSDPVTSDYLGGTRGSANWWLNQSGSVTTQSVSALYNYIVLSAFYIPETVTVDRVAVHVSVLGSGDIRLGLYAHDPTTGRPSSRLADWGLVSATTTGVKELTISYTFNKGWYWLAHCWQTSNTTAHTYTANPLNTLNIPVFLGTSSSGMSSSRGVSYYSTGVTGALPSSASGAISNNINNSMRVAFRTA
jgi:hypothetical protein